MVEAIDPKTYDEALKKARVLEKPQEENNRNQRSLLEGND